MAVGHVVDHLADSPAVGAIGGVELFVGQSADSSAEVGGGGGKGVDPFGPLRRGGGGGTLKPADGVTEIGLCIHPQNHTSEERHAMDGGGAAAGMAGRRR